MVDSYESSPSGSSNPVCPICFKRKTDPRVLPCGHSFCKSCVEALLQSVQVSCPVCLTSITVSLSDILAPNIFSLNTQLTSNENTSEAKMTPRDIGACSRHSKTCDQFCRKCEQQMCEDCVQDQHAFKGHDVESVDVIVRQQTDVVDTTLTELLTLSEELAEITKFTSRAEGNCVSRLKDLMNETKVAVQTTGKEANQGETALKKPVQQRKDMHRKLDSIIRIHSEVTLLTNCTVDFCLSFRQDLQAANVSKTKAFKSVQQTKENIIKGIAQLKDMTNKFAQLDLHIQSRPIECNGSKMNSRKSSVPRSKSMKTLSLSDLLVGNYSYSCGIVWPQMNWIVSVARQNCSNHKYIQFKNFHFLRGEFISEMGIEKAWHAISPNVSTDGRSMLCLASKQIHKFSFPVTENIEHVGEVVKTVFSLPDMIGMSWDEERSGCYALLADGKTLLHIDIENSKVSKEVLQLPESVKLTSHTHIMHVKVDGSMAVCDQGNRVIRFYQSLDGTPGRKVDKPEEGEEGVEAVPWCINARREDELWYALWVYSSIDKKIAKMFVYDQSFLLLGKVMEVDIDDKTPSTSTFTGFTFQPDSQAPFANFSFGSHRAAPDINTSTRRNESKQKSAALTALKVSFCFQGQYMSLQLGKRVFVYFLS